MLKSFTGVVWELPSWKSPPAQLQDGDESRDGKEISQDSANNSKANDSSTAAESTGAGGAEPMMVSSPPASSPVTSVPELAARS